MDDALVDTASTGHNANYVNERTAQLLRLSMTAKWTTSQLAGDNACLKGRVAKPVDITLNGEVYPITFIVANINHSMIIGHSFLAKHGFIVNCKTGELSVNSISDPTPIQTAPMSDEQYALWLENKMKEDFPDLFAPPKDLPTHAPEFEHKIDLVDDYIPYYQKIYPMSEDELALLRKDLAALQDKGFIRASKSPWGAPVFYVTEPTKKRLVFDYRRLNEQTKKDRTALPYMRELFDRLTGAKKITKVDAMAGFHLI